MIARLLDKDGEEIARTETTVFDDDHPVIFMVGRKGAGRLPMALEVTVQFRERVPEVAPRPGDTVTVTASAATCAVTAP